MRRWIFAGIGIIAIIATYFLLSPDDASFPARALQPGPPQAANCAGPRIRASAVSVDELEDLLHGHGPAWLPEGMGLIRAFGPDGDETGGHWAAADCRQLNITVNDSPGEASGWAPLDGAAAQEEQCFTEDLGDTDCWNTSRSYGGYSITIQTLGVTRDETQHIADSMS